jgi:hypothetical protein
MNHTAWQDVVDALPATDKLATFAWVMRSRVRFVPVCLNGRCWMVQRAAYRDYLRAVTA